jgi:glycosyltransferase involved in cell wall biosynthesis
MTNHSIIRPVGVWMITYNHANYVRQAIESVLSQKCEFEFSLHIGDDHSTDGTSDICREYAVEHPDFVHYHLRNSNLGVLGNALQTLKDCLDSDYQFIAFLEGDDYWIDPLKLQQQVEHLVNKPSVSMVFTAAQKKLGTSFNPYYENGYPPETFALDEFILNRVQIPTCTVLLRREAVEEIVNVLSGLKHQIFHVDYLMWCVVGCKGNYAFLPRNTAVYRVHEASIIRSTPSQKTLELGISLNRFLANYLPSRFETHFLENNWWYYLEFAFAAIRDGKLLKSIYWLFRSLLESARFEKSNQLQIIRDYLYRLRNRNSN